MPETIVSIVRKNLRSNLSDLLNPADYPPFERAVKNSLSGMGVTAVSADIKGGGQVIELTISAPQRLNEDAVRNALS